MKPTLFIFPLTVLLLFSSCHFFEGVVVVVGDDVKYADNGAVPVMQDEFIWICCPEGNLCESKNFTSIANALKSIEDLGVYVYDSKTERLNVKKECGHSTGVYFLAKIKRADIKMANYAGWYPYSGHTKVN